MTNSKSEEKQFLKFAILICVTGVILSTFFGVLWGNFSSNGNKFDIPTTSIDYEAQLAAARRAPLKFSAVSGASSDFNRSPKPWWIYEKDSVFKLSNPSTEMRIVNLELSLDRNPCRFDVTGNLSFRNSIIALVPGEPLSLNITMKGKSSIILPLSVSAFACSVDPDPRVFLASLSSSYSFSLPTES
jgi:hypothetical protein